MPMWGAGTTGGNLTCSATMLAPGVTEILIQHARHCPSVCRLALCQASNFFAFRNPSRVKAEGLSSFLSNHLPWASMQHSESPCTSIWLLFDVLAFQSLTLAAPLGFGWSNL